MQAAHAVLAFTLAHPGLCGAQDTLILLAAQDELELCWLLASARRQGARAVPFYEPDLDHALTAVALGGGLTIKYPLALRRGVREKP